jgi:uncharacterized membrane protein YbhN (UPF0104 family)
VGTVIKTVLALAIVLGVGRQFVRILGDESWQWTGGIQRWELIPLVGLLYLAAHSSWGSFWVRLLREQGVKVSWYAGLRCYFVSQFGKYVPGKAWVIVLRVGMLSERWQAPAMTVAMTATYETLASMGAGALVAVLCLPFLGVLPPEVLERWGWFVLVAALPAGLALVHRMIYAGLRQRGKTNAAVAPSWFLLLQGTLHGVIGWLLLGVSLGLLLEAMQPGLEWTGSRAVALLGTVALAYVAGFVVLVTPGGLGVREWVLLHTLPPLLLAGGDTAPTIVAALAALWLRLVWTIAEVICAGLLYLRPALPPHMIPLNLPRQSSQPYV